MTDIFISYAREDRETAHRLAEALTAHGLSTWWDREILIGSNFADEILSQLNAASVVCVLWSDSALASEFVYDEASRAHRGGKLLPVRIGTVEPPLGFGALQTLDLLDWDGDADAPDCQELIGQLRQRVALPAKVRHRPAALMRWGAATTRRRWLAGGAVVAAGGALGAHGWQRFQRYLADDYVLAGLEANRANDLEAARRQFLLALDYAPRHAVAHYELANVYLRLYLEGGSRDARFQVDARVHFTAAVDSGRGLDTQQLGDATRLAASLAAPDASAAVARAVTPEAVDTPGAPLVSAPPQRVAASDAVDRSAELQSAALFDASRERRVSAFNVLAVNPSLAADSTRPALERAVAASRSDPASPATRDGVSQTLALLQSASPGTLRGNRAQVEALVDAARAAGGRNADAAARVQAQLDRAATLRPVVYLQIASAAQRKLADTISQRMVAAGYLTPSVELVGEGRAPDRTSLRVQGMSDAGYARWCEAMLSELLGEPVDVSTLRNARPKTDTYEIWLGKTLCSGAEQRGCT